MLKQTGTSLLVVRTVGRALFRISRSPVTSLKRAFRSQSSSASALPFPCPGNLGLALELIPPVLEETPTDA